MDGARRVAKKRSIARQSAQTSRVHLTILHERSAAGCAIPAPLLSGGMCWSLASQALGWQPGRGPARPRFPIRLSRFEGG
jgi:hypothetical protein